MQKLVVPTLKPRNPTKQKRATIKHKNKLKHKPKHKKAEDEN